MTISFLLRLKPDAMGEGRIAGHAEVVETGQSVVFKDLEEMLAFLQRSTRELTRAPEEDFDAS